MVLLEPNPDWVQLTNAITIMINRQASAILMLRNPATDLSMANLTANDTLFLLGHGDPNDAGGYSPAQLAEALRDRNLPQDHKFIVLTTCEAGLPSEPDGTFIARLVIRLGELGYRRAHATGAAGLAISGWGVDQVVDPAAKDEYCFAQDRSEAQNRGALQEAASHAAEINVNSSSDEIVAKAKIIAQLLEYFYENLFVRANQYLLLPRSVPRQRGPSMYRLNLTGNPHEQGMAIRSSLNRSPQNVTIYLEQGIEIRATYWAWERASVLRVEAPADITVRPHPGMGALASVEFRRPGFTLDVASITRA
ncbi:MAG TPA: hypothetical protein VFY65_17745 [Longimicrobium sp.]|nr:hypothetical protein [Longimicrobium sp.]